VSDRRQNNQLELALRAESRGEAPMAVDRGTESLTAERSIESPATTECLMEEVCERENLREALKESGQMGVVPGWMGCGRRKWWIVSARRAPSGAPGPTASMLSHVDRVIGRRGQGGQDGSRAGNDS
jgi:hypothetical protein